MELYQSLKHTRWDCNDHIVWILKYRKKAIWASLRKYLDYVLRDFAQQKEGRVWEGHLMPDHVHMLVSIPPKHSVSQVVVFLKGKSAIYVARNFGGR